MSDGMIHILQCIVVAIPLAMGIVAARKRHVRRVEATRTKLLYERLADADPAYGSPAIAREDRRPPKPIAA
jgi:hypothetical protein